MRNTIIIREVGGQGNMVFSGGSAVFAINGAISIDTMREDSALFDIDANSLIDSESNSRFNNAICREKIGEDYQALMMGLKDYHDHHNFDGAIIAISGGIDSALTTIIAADALGSNNVLGVIMPTRYTSEESINNANLLAETLGIELLSIDIDDTYCTLLEKISNTPGKEKSRIYEENIQARIRGTILMSLSNKYNMLVVATSNRSESLVGYSTLYGDTCGGYAVLKYVYKTNVYAFSRWRNDHIPGRALVNKSNVIHNSILIRAPSAELKYNQRDNDSLPEYDVLDAILHEIVDKNTGKEQLIALGHDKEIICTIYSMVKKSAFKRLQSPIGPNIYNYSDHICRF